MSSEFETKYAKTVKKIEVLNLRGERIYWRKAVDRILSRVVADLRRVYAGRYGEIKVFDHHGVEIASYN